MNEIPCRISGVAVLSLCENKCDVFIQNNIVMEQKPMNRAVDALMESEERWREEYMLLRRIVLDCGLDEEVKWGVPCYTVNAKNVVLIHGFKQYCALLFFKGALLRDEAGILIRQSENVQAGRQVRFAGAKRIAELEFVLKAYIAEAVEVEKAGLQVEFKKTEAFPVAGEFERRMADMPALRTAFGTLTPGRQRAYLLYFASAKLPATRESRIDKSIPGILNGKGLND
jgi:uncharacterized protein YdeI (YjbR/CyaY-like superfamily)